MRTYPSKLLLFGEHVLLLGSTALAMPVPVYSGKWNEKTPVVQEALQQQVLEFAKSEYLRRIEALDTKAFIQDLQNGLVFESNIPIGYGLGSSGALCAAVYDRYCRAKTVDLAALKAVFSQMESYFHGSSSGIDPLTSYVKKPLLIRNKTEVVVAEMSPWNQQPIVFLIDSTLPRQTGPLVRWFLDRSAEVEFSKTLHSEYLPVHELVVQSWLSGDADVFWPNLQQVSQFQLSHFEPMIPSTLREIWMENLETRQIIFKICGAGGGGYMLGFSKTREAVQVLNNQFSIVFPFTISP